MKYNAVVRLEFFISVSVEAADEEAAKWEIHNEIDQMSFYGSQANDTDINSLYSQGETK